MSGYKVLAIACGLGLLAASGPYARGDDFDKRTTLTVNQPVMVPGATLEPGTYEFRLAGSRSNRNIVQIVQEGGDFHHTVLARPAHRFAPAGETIFTYWETTGASAPALRTWFYPGDNYGQEFAYSEEEMQRLAAGGQQPMLQMQQREEPVEIAQAAPPQQPAQPEPQPEPEQPAATQPAQPEPQPEQPAVTQPAQPEPEPQPAAPEQPAMPERLPATASPFPLIGLAGLLAMGAGFALRKLS